MFIDCKYTNKKTNHKEFSVFFSTKQHTGLEPHPSPPRRGGSSGTKKESVNR